jgi:hypothetical protein
MNKYTSVAHKYATYCTSIATLFFQIVEFLTLIRKLLRLCRGPGAVFPLCKHFSRLPLQTPVRNVVPDGGRLNPASRGSRKELAKERVHSAM